MGPQYPRVLYHPEKDPKLVQGADEEAEEAKRGWRREPYPKPEPSPEPTLEDRVKVLEERFSEAMKALDGRLRAVEKKRS